jgi:hypothetical protein
MFSDTLDGKSSVRVAQQLIKLAKQSRGTDDAEDLSY